MHQVICWFVYIEKNPRLTGFLDSNLHTRLAIVTENELGLAFPPRNLPKKFRPDPSTFYLVIVATNRQTDRQTYAGDYIIPRQSFRGDNNRRHLCTLCMRCGLIIGPIEQIRYLSPPKVYLRWGIRAPSNSLTWFPERTRVCRPDGISVGSDVLRGFRS